MLFPVLRVFRGSFMRNDKIGPRKTRDPRNTYCFFAPVAAGFAAGFAAGVAAGVAGGLAAGVGAGAGPVNSASA